MKRLIGAVCATAIGLFGSYSLVQAGAAQTKASGLPEKVIPGATVVMRHLPPNVGGSASGRVRILRNGEGEPEAVEVVGPLETLLVPWENVALISTPKPP
jgi:hypothetical protein